MQYNILLVKNEDKQEVEILEQSRFLKSLLEALEVPIIWNPEEPLSIDAKLKLRKSLNTYNINVIDDMDGGLKVFVDSDLIGEWYKCSYKLKEDLTQTDPRKKLYLEMSVNFWTIFENIK
jgi:hypothetical protein